MKINKTELVKHLKRLGKYDEAGRAAEELPDTIDTKTHSASLQKFGIDPTDLPDKFGGLFQNRELYGAEVGK